MNAKPQQQEFEPIQTVDVEQLILGTLLLHNGLWPKASGALTLDDFTEDLHKQLFQAIGDLINRSQPASPPVIVTYFGDRDLGGVNLSHYLYNLVAECADPFNFSHYVRALQDGAGRREIDASVREFIENGATRDLSRSASELAGDLLSHLRTVMARGAESETRRTAGESAGALIANAKKIMAKEMEQLASPTGFHDLDNATGGYEAGCLWVIGARPGMGKTALAVASARQVARSGDAALVFSLEVPEQQMTARILSEMSYTNRRTIPFGDIYRGRNLNPEDLWALEDAQKRLVDLPLVIDYPNRPTMGNISARVRSEKERYARLGIRLGVVFIDYLKFVKASDRYAGQRVYEVGEITAGLKALAREEEICVVLLAQLNRANEQRDDKRPTLADIRESGDIEADADVVAFIHRDAYYLEKTPKYRDQDPDAMTAFEEAKNRADLIIGKNRSGPTKTIDLWCDMAASKFSTAGRS